MRILECERTAGLLCAFAQVGQATFGDVTGDASTLVYDFNAHVVLDADRDAECGRAGMPNRVAWLRYWIGR